MQTRSGNRYKRAKTDATRRRNRQKRAETNDEKDCEEDLINQLPDGIPEAIISKLPINEAAKTSILSKKWRKLWTFYSGTLEFDGSPTMKDMKKYIEMARGRTLQAAMQLMYEAERRTYTNWINKLLKSIQSSTLEGLKFWFDADYACDIDSWIQFAIQKKVQKLELYFGQIYEYVLPLQIFKVAGYNSLCVLRLKFIKVTKEMLEYLLLSCPLLETLRLVNSVVPKTMKVSGSSLKLKCLEVVRCWELTNLEIFAEELVSFRYFGSHLGLEFKSVPRLVEASFGGSFVDFVRESYLPQIKVLKLDITQNVPKVICNLFQLPKLKNLKHLELIANVNDWITLGACDMLLNASPSLWRFTLKLANTYPTYRGSELFRLDCPYNLKELEVVGFSGEKCDVDLVMCLVENTVELQKLIIDTRLPVKPKLRRLGEHFKTWNHEESIKCALELREKIPPCIEFVCF